MASLLTWKTACYHSSNGYIMRSFRNSSASKGVDIPSMVNGDNKGRKGFIVGSNCMAWKYLALLEALSAG